jgi:DNA-binding transcriptional MerR regulator
VVSEYRVEELARRAGTSVRNVRVYQDRGLLDPPRREGRVGYYSDRHLERLRLIGRLLDRGYTFATIGELLAAWTDGGGLGHVLGLTEAIGGPWSQEEPGHVTLDELLRRFGPDDASVFVVGAIEVGMLEPDGAGFRVPSPHLLDAAADLVAAGVPLATVLDLTQTLRAHLDRVAALFFHAVSANLPGLAGETARTAGDVEARVAELVARLRPHAGRTVEAVFALAMRERAAQVVEQLTGADRPAGRLTG